MGNILEDARADATIILTDGGFETSITFTSPTLTQIITNGLAIRRTDTLLFDDGAKEHSPFASISVPLAPFNFTEKYVSFQGWKVEFQDSGLLREYKLGDSLPNYTLGFVNITLKDE